jgi:cellulose synthase/poly-beta-1,6-N-acetylglucosamine synthase-like glycosyltransferase
LSGSSLVLLWVVGLWALLWGRGRIEIRRTVQLSPRPGSTPPVVTAYLPARNEVEVIEASVRALLQESALQRLVVVDDGSTDGTDRVLGTIVDPRLLVLAGAGPGPGECGKPAALRGAVNAQPPTTDWLLFVDADVILSPGALAALVGHAEETGAELLSLYPQLVHGSFIESLVMPTIGALVLRRYPPALVGDPHSRVAFANGQVILIRRELYLRIGGHQAVVTEILEDVRLAELCKAAGGRLGLVDGRALARTRMYAGWSELLEGWGKNLHLLLGAQAWRSVFWMLALPVLSAAPLLAGLWVGGVVGFGAWALVVLMQADLRRLAGASPLYAPLAPLGASLAAVVVGRSLWLHHGRRPVPWKGRRYSAGDPKGT